jgi:hypothetical protein
MTGVRQEASKFIDVILEVVLPQEKIAHVSRNGKVVIFRSPQDTPRCGLKGHGVFKGVYEVQEDSRKRRKGEDGLLKFGQNSILLSC